MPPEEWDRGTFTARISEHAYRIGPRWSPRRKLRRKRNRQWWRNFIKKAKKVKNLTCRADVSEGFPVITYEIESEVGKTIRHELMYGASIGTAALPIEFCL